MRAFVVLAAALVLLVGCSSDDDGAATSSATSTGTDVRALNPLDPDGAPADGYTARAIPTVAPLECYTAITGGYRCSDTPEARQFCWEAADSTAACLADPRDRELRMMGATFAMLSETYPYVPAALDLADGSRCTLGKNPMAMATGNIAYVHVYGCTGGPTTGVYTEPLPGLGNPVRDVIDRSAATWTVQGGDDTGPNGRVDVVVAYEVTAG